MFYWQVLCTPCSNNITKGNIDLVKNDLYLTVCFLKLFLIVPLYCVLTISSAYYIGFNKSQYNRSFIQILAVNIRATIVFILILFNVYGAFLTFFNFGDFFQAKIDFILAICECYTWSIHFFYVLSLRKRHTSNSRGPVLICVIWSILFTFQLLLMKFNWDLITHYNSNILLYTQQIIRIILFVLYAVTFIPGKRVVKSNLIEEETILRLDMENISYFSQLNFLWVNSLIRKGKNIKLNDTNDLFELPEFIKEYINQKTDHILLITLKNIESSFIKCLWKIFGYEYVLIGSIRLLSDLANFTLPLLLKRLIEFVNDKSISLIYGYGYGISLIVIVLMSTYTKVHFNFRMSLLNLKLKSCLSTALYQKILNTQNINSVLSSGEVLNFISTDVARIVNCFDTFHNFWSYPLQILVIFYLLYTQVGKACIVCIVLSIITIISTSIIGWKCNQLSTDFLKWKDKRVKLINDILHGIRYIKIHNWEFRFEKLINNIRNYEIKILKYRKYLDGFCVYFATTSINLILFLTIIVYVDMGNSLSSSTIFTAMFLLNLLANPLNSLPWSIFGLVELFVSIKRVQKLFNIKDFDLKDFYSKKSVDDDNNYDIVLSNTDLSWQGEFSSPQLKSLNLKVYKGEFLGVTGPTGCGKSTLLIGILAEVNKVNGDVFLNGFKDGVGYVGQQVWLQRGTIRENILFGQTYDVVKYRKILNACCLTRDIQTLNNGDLTNVGEGGCLISDGQRIRVALARALYQEKNIYIIDDIFSLIDWNVSKKIFENCFLNLLKRKTRILVTNRVEFLSKMDHVVEVTLNGSLRIINDPIELDNMPFEISEMDLEENEHDEFILQDEISELQKQGTLKFSVVFFYIKKIGYILSILIIFFIILLQIFSNLFDWLLTNWVNSVEEDLKYTGYKYSSILAILITSINIVALIKVFVFAYGNLSATKAIHESLVHTVIKAKMSFFDSQPIGRIVNRFSSDTITVDDIVPFMINLLISMVFSLIGTIAVIILQLPWILTLLIPLYPIFHYIQTNYRITIRELKRLSTVTLSPIYSHFSDTYCDLKTIRAFKYPNRLIRKNEKLIENHIKAEFSTVAVSNLFDLQLRIIGVIIICGACIIALVYRHMGIGNASSIGLAINYAWTITGLLSVVFSALVFAEQQMICVERINEYIENIDTENFNTSMLVYKSNWPSNGVIVFENVVFKHSLNAKPALKNVSFRVNSGEKLAIIGRTGAGKSSIISALCRLSELISGVILIDSVNISNISLKKLRSSISVVSHNNFLFSTTIRDNIDPLNNQSDLSIWEALEKCCIKSKIESIGGIDAYFDSSDLKLSIGEKQLLCLTRAFLQNSKIICFDEATSNIDDITDEKIQKTMSDLFHDKTVIIITHKIKNIDNKL